MRKIILVVGFLMMYIGTFCDENNMEIAEELTIDRYVEEDYLEGKESDFVRKADTFVFHSPKVGEVIDYEDIEYTVLPDMTLKVTKVNPGALSFAGVLNIPEKIGGGYQEIRSTLVVFMKELPVRVMGKKVMRDRLNLREVNMPSVKEVEDSTFFHCGALTKISMPMLEIVRTRAFCHCQALTVINMPEIKTVDCYAFYWCNALITVQMPKVKIVGQEAFAYCSKLNQVSMPKTGCCFKKDSFFLTPWQPGMYGIVSSC